MMKLLKNKWVLFIGGGIILTLVLVGIFGEASLPTEVQPSSTQKEQQRPSPDVELIPPEEDLEKGKVEFKAPEE